jgi:solute carrier family 35, member C2
MFDKDHLDFHFPLYTTSLHMIVQFCLSTLVLFFVPSLRPSQLSQPYTRLPTSPIPSDDLDSKPKPVITPLFWLTRLLPCGTATSLDIGLGNTSLRYITLTFLTMCKSSSLAFVLLFAFLFRLETPSYKLILIIATMTVGVVMMVAGEADFKPLGFALVIASSFFSGFRWGLTQILLLRHPATSNPFATLFFLSPIMFVSLVCIATFAEGPIALHAGLSELAEKKGSIMSTLLLLFPGCLAFCMTTSEYSLLQRTNVVTLSICGIFKEVVTITAAEMVYHDPLTPINVSGLLITIGSIASYNYLKITKMRQEARREVARGGMGPDSPVSGGGRRRSSVGLLNEADDEGESTRSLSADPKLLAGGEARGGTPSRPKRQQDLE